MKSKSLYFLLSMSFFHVLLFGFISNVAFGRDASGSVSGNLSCADGSISLRSQLAFSAFMSDVPVYGNWEITSNNGSSLGTHNIAGYLSGGNVGNQDFDLKGTETSDDICGTQITSGITISGFCGPTGTVQINLNNGWRGEFGGNIECTG